MKEPNNVKLLTFLNWSFNLDVYNFIFKFSSNPPKDSTQSSTRIFKNVIKQAGAELCQAKLKLGTH